MNGKSIALIIGAIFLLVLMIVALIDLAPGFIQKRRLVKAIARPVGDYGRKWAQDDFINLTDKNIDSLCSNLKISSKGILNQAEELQLRDTAGRFLRAYSRGDFESFLAFRFPITNGTFKVKYFAHAVDFLTTNGVDRAILETNKPLAIWRVMWDFPLLNLCTNCFLSVGRNGSGIAVDESERLPELNLGNLLEYYGSVASANTLYGRVPFFIFDPSPESILARKGKIKHALIWMIVQTPGTAPIPTYCQVYWAEDLGKWLPCFIGECEPDGQHRPHFVYLF